MDQIMSMWNKVTGIRSRDGAQAAGLEYGFPCGHSVFVPMEEIKAYTDAPHDEAKDPAPEVCGHGCEKIEAGSETDQITSNVIPFEKRK